MYDRVSCETKKYVRVFALNLQNLFTTGFDKDLSIKLKKKAKKKIQRWNK